jgi:hypothetical protein
MRVAFSPARRCSLDLSYRTMIAPPRTRAVCQLQTFAANVSLYLKSEDAKAAVPGIEWRSPPPLLA